MTCDLTALRSLLKSEDPSEILCIFSTTSCFAPREPDDVVEVGKLAREFGVYHLVNNAYGLQCSKTVDMLNRANAEGLIDFLVQSTDKNFAVPVGGSVGMDSICLFNKKSCITGSLFFNMKSYVIGSIFLIVILGFIFYCIRIGP